MLTLSPTKHAELFGKNLSSAAKHNVTLSDSGQAHESAQPG